MTKSGLHVVGSVRHTKAYFGHLAKAHDTTERPVALARHADSPEAAGYYLVSAALRDSEISNVSQARRQANASLALNPGRDGVVGAALTFARLADDVRPPVSTTSSRTRKVGRRKIL
jgi:hypothetical protein